MGTNFYANPNCGQPCEHCRADAIYIGKRSEIGRAHV